jgi:hypothetical protein
MVKHLAPRDVLSHAIRVLILPMTLIGPNQSKFMTALSVVIIAGSAWLYHRINREILGIGPSFEETAAKVVQIDLSSPSNCPSPKSPQPILSWPLGQFRK